jgi:hypothetical protein
MKKLWKYIVGGAMMLSALAAAPAFAAPAFVNPNFNQGTSGFNGWNHYAGFANASAFRVQGSSFRSASSRFRIKQVGSVSQIVAGFQTGHMYKFSALVQGQGTVRITGPAGSRTAFLNNSSKFAVSTFVDAAPSLNFRAMLIASGSSRQINISRFNLTDLSPAAAVPEIDPRSGAIPAALALGGLALMSDRRKKAAAKSQPELTPAS